MPFYSDQIANAIKMHSSKQDQSYGAAKFAKLVEYNPEMNLVRVAWYNPNTDDDDLISGWLPLIVPMLGRGDDTDAPADDAISWGLVYPPNIDQRVMVISQHGDFNNGLVIGGNYSPICPPPTVDDEFTQNGEFLLMHKSGSYLKFFNNGDVTLHTAANLNFLVDQDWNVTVERNTTFTLKGNFDRTVDGNESATIKGNQNLKLTGNRSDTITGNDTLNLSGSKTEDIGGSRTENIGGSATEQIGGLKSTTASSIAVNAAGLISVTSGGLISIISGIEIDILAPIVIIDE